MTAPTLQSFRCAVCGGTEYVPVPGPTTCVIPELGMPRREPLPVPKLFECATCSAVFTDPEKFSQTNPRRR